MGCAEKDCCTAFAKDGDLSFPGTEGHGTPWKFYNHLIGHVPEDVMVTDYCLGTHRVLAWRPRAAWALPSRPRAARSAGIPQDLRGMPLRSVAQLAKSWCFEEASLGVAALNAWYARPELLDPLGATYDEPVEALP